MHMYDMDRARDRACVCLCAHTRKWQAQQNSFNSWYEYWAEPQNEMCYWNALKQNKSKANKNSPSTNSICPFAGCAKRVKRWGVRKFDRHTTEHWKLRTMCDLRSHMFASSVHFVWVPKNFSEFEFGLCLCVGLLSDLYVASPETMALFSRSVRNKTIIYYDLFAPNNSFA